MPLPSGGVWPPRHLQPIYSHYSLLDTWYRGVPEELAAMYGGQQPANRPSQLRGGLVGWAARMFWGQPTPQGEKLTKLHIPVASDIATMSADLMFSEPPSITCENEQTQAHLDDMLPQLQATLLEGAEVGAALGGYYLRAVWDPDVAPAPWLSAVHADAAVPEWRFGRLHACTFWRILESDDTTCWWHLEHHQPGSIQHALFKGAPGQLGDQMPLTAHPETEKLKPVVTTGIDRCTAIYIPNMRPNRTWRNYPAGANLGRSDFDGPVLGLMDALDETWTSWMRDIRLAKARLIVPSSYLENAGRGKGSYFDLDRELYEAVNPLVNSERLEISPQQFAIRFEEHRETQAEQLAAILRATGYSSQSFGLGDDGVAITATEVSAKERRSLTTRAKKGLYTLPALGDGLEMLLQLTAEQFPGLGVVPERPTIVLADSVSPDMLQLAQVAELWRRAEAASDETLVQMLHPDWDDKQVKDEVKLIGDARPDPLADLSAFGQPPGVEPGEEGQDGPPGREE
ncbi:hypothetical protein ACIBKY_52125 [Nonomuraea sp. NPDC050394]|uniref:hypothetical protein n=1 Tax=Nonomuraea sp. NPDC050394 TaxID=3364363 RepID=UPI0037B93AF1